MQCLGYECVILFGIPPVVYPSSNVGEYLRYSRGWRSSDWRSQLRFLYSATPLTSTVINEGYCTTVAKHKLRGCGHKKSVILFKRRAETHAHDTLYSLTPEESVYIPLFSFFAFKFANENRITNSFFVFRFQICERKTNSFFVFRFHKWSKKNEKRKTKIEKRKTKNETRKTKNEKRKTKNEKRKTKNEKRKTKNEKRIRFCI